MTNTKLLPSACNECNDTKSELRRRRVSGGAVQLLFQCLTCGRAASLPIAKNLVLGRPEALPEWDEGLQKQYFEHNDRASKIKRQQEHAEWLQAHTDYLQSRKWKSLRARVLTRSGGLCEGCRSSPATQVHHLTYDHWRDELLWELVAICNDCHHRAHRVEPS